MFALIAAGLDIAELVECFVELTGEARAVKSKVGEGVDGGLGVGALLGAYGVGEEVGFEERNASEAPGGFGELLSRVLTGSAGYGW